jgi:hypothetical protein
VLKEEIQQLIRQGEIDVDVIFVSKNFHVDYSLLEKNLRRTIERTLPRLKKSPFWFTETCALDPTAK